MSMRLAHHWLAAVSDLMTDMRAAMTNGAAFRLFLALSAPAPSSGLSFLSAQPRLTPGGTCTQSMHSGEWSLLGLLHLVCMHMHHCSPSLQGS